jgi:ribosomal protein S18 acetylase RimI-like enzyme
MDPDLRMSREEATMLLARAPFVRIVSTGEDGAPILRTVVAVVEGGWLAFPGPQPGEASEALGRPALACAEEIVAAGGDGAGPHPPAIFALSARVQATIERVVNPGDEARIGAALLAKVQTATGSVSSAEETTSARRGTGAALLRMSLERAAAIARLGEDLPIGEVARVVDRLWRRGRAGDDYAVERILAANPRIPTPIWLQGPRGTRLLCALDGAGVVEAVALVEREYWNRGTPRDRLERAMRGSTAIVGARAADGQLVAVARALGDGARSGWIGDVCVAPEWRGRGVGAAVVRLLLDHPCLREADRIRLNTRDAQGLYAKLGFVETLRETSEHPSTEMILRRR